MSVYLFPGERSGAQPPSPPVGAPDGSLGSCSEAKEDEKEEEGDGDTLDSDEFCILDAPGLGIPVCGGQAGQGQGAVGGELSPRPFWSSFCERGGRRSLSLGLGLGGSPSGGSPDSGLRRSTWVSPGSEKARHPGQGDWHQSREEEKQVVSGGGARRTIWLQGCWPPGPQVPVRVSHARKSQFLGRQSWQEQGALSTLLRRTLRHRSQGQ